MPRIYMVWSLGDIFWAIIIGGALMLWASVYLGRLWHKIKGFWK